MQNIVVQHRISSGLMFWENFAPVFTWKNIANIFVSTGLCTHSKHFWNQKFRLWTLSKNFPTMADAPNPPQDVKPDLAAADSKVPYHMWRCPSGSCFQTSFWHMHLDLNSDRMELRERTSYASVYVHRYVHCGFCHLGWRFVVDIFRFRHTICDLLSSGCFWCCGWNAWS